MSLELSIGPFYVYLQGGLDLALTLIVLATMYAWTFTNPRR